VVKNQSDVINIAYGRENNHLRMPLMSCSPSATFGMLTKRYSLKRPIEASVRRVVKLIMWNGGTIPAANQTQAMFVRPYHFQSLISIMNWLLEYLSSATILQNHHFQFDHYRFFLVVPKLTNCRILSIFLVLAYFPP